MKALERFDAFLKTEEAKSFLAFIFYLTFILICIDLPGIIYAICTIVQIFIFLLALAYYIPDPYTLYTHIFSINFRTIMQKIEKIVIELMMFIPVICVSIYINTHILSGIPENQTGVDEMINEFGIIALILVIILGPIYEELIFRLLPRKFIKSPILYITVSSVVFAGMHVISYPNPLYYIWFYMVLSVYYGYRYYKTNDISVSISLHIFNNFLASLPQILSLF